MTKNTSLWGTLSWTVRTYWSDSFVLRGRPYTSTLDGATPKDSRLSWQVGYINSVLRFPLCLLGPTVEGTDPSESTTPVPCRSDRGTSVQVRESLPPLTYPKTSHPTLPRPLSPLLSQT